MRLLACKARDLAGSEDSCGTALPQARVCFVISALVQCTALVHCTSAAVHCTSALVQCTALHFNAALVQCTSAAVYCSALHYAFARAQNFRRISSVCSAPRQHHPCSAPREHHPRQPCHRLRRRRPSRRSRPPVHPVPVRSVRSVGRLYQRSDSAFSLCAKPPRTALHCSAVHCSALRCNALRCAALQCTAVHCAALHCAALHRAALRCTTPFSTAALTSSDSGSILCIAAAAAVLGLTKRRRTARWRARSLKDPFSRSARALARSRSRSVARVLALKRTSDRARRSRPRTRPRRGDRAVPRSGTYPARGRAGFRCFFSVLAASRVLSCWGADELTSSIQLNLCLAAATGLESWGLALLLGLVILCQLCAAAAAPVAGLAAVATSSPVTFAVAAVGTAALANARRDGGGCRSQSSGSGKSRKAKAGTFPRRLRAGFQRSVPCKPLGVTRAGDSPASSSKPVPRSGTYPACGRAGFRCFFPDSLLAVCFRAGARTN